jgi:predicted dehydrogenase
MHVFCEKPLALNLEEADRMIETVKRSGVKAMSGHVLRFWPVYLEVKEIVKSGMLGKPLHAYCERLIALPDWQEGAWHLKQPGGLSAALDVQIHDLDYLMSVFGKPLLVSALGLHDDRHGGWMHINSRVEFEEGRNGFVQAGWGYPAAYPFTVTLRVICDRGAVEWNFKAGKLLEQRDSEAPLMVYRDSGSYEVEDVDRRDPFLLEWLYFIECIDRDRPVENATLEQGRAALELARASIKSAVEGGALQRIG